MEIYTAENALELLRLGRISVLSNESDLVKSKFNAFYDPSGKGYDFIDATWRSVLDVIPTNIPEGAIIDMAFQERIIDSGIAKKIREGTPLHDLIQ